MSLKYKFNEALDFPCDQHMRIIVLNEDSQPQRLVDQVNSILPESTSVDGVIDSRLSANGKYVSYTLRVRFDSAENMELLYEKLPKSDFVKHLL
ncbi:DUF493 domain-containing protein [Anaerobiospirillum sp. NML120449]|uniref:DUF493 domain-containing protein n=1 Tax=Anaerobiospirillum sp. NML120449 TaxID=2932817 RepID=UPI001FF68FE9|nr:DUF493 domain-containing protein [Anaerobiospirillum sp. NML120449]MCK0526541.1 DUF493 domain-containing protein [Anaerobiospirillum sp. NML120449]